MSQHNIDKLNQSLPNTAMSLTQTDLGLAVCHKEYAPLIIDFLSPKLQYRSQHSALGELVAKACGAKNKPYIIDLTAGLGRDAYLLASLGCHVLMIERHPAMHALLEDALLRLKETQPNIQLFLHHQNSHLLSLDKFSIPEVIYVDPMHPERVKTALVKKEMRILRELVGEDVDRLNLIEHAFSLGVKKVVVKWPAKQPLELSIKPTHSFKGKSVRFDVFSLAANQHG